MDAFVQRQPRAQAPLPQRAPTDDVEPEEHPAKRQKVDHCRRHSRSENSSVEGDSVESNESIVQPVHGVEERLQDEVEDQRHSHPAIEDALPPVESDKQAVEDYKAFKASQASEKEDASAAKAPMWVQGRSSIYVDAFNLALDTVLEDESHLFDDKEHAVFSLWRQLDYEAQYL